MRALRNEISSAEGDTGNHRCRCARCNRNRIPTLRDRAITSRTALERAGEDDAYLSVAPKFFKFGSFFLKKKETRKVEKRDKIQKQRKISSLSCL